jgi:hypothetical protein
MMHSWKMLLALISLALPLLATAQTAIDACPANSQFKVRQAACRSAASVSQILLH